MIENQEKCIKLLAPNVDKKQKFHLSQMVNDLYTVKNVLVKRGNQDEDSNHIRFSNFRINILSLMNSQQFAVAIHL